ncbi:MAG: hypothetical protein E7Z78_07010 [Methanobrevibacter thaueri]|nr:hypothetical protein [Methanobrevibacter thaueri]
MSSFFRYFPGNSNVTCACCAHPETVNRNDESFG